jgi:F-type H+-transporting ATPase subunit delta
LNAAEYGKALFLLAKEEGLCDKIKTEAEAIGILLSENPKYITLLDTPALPTEEKNLLLDKAFGGFHEYLLNFMKILTSKRAMYLFSRAISAYKDAYEEDNNILNAYAVTAVPLSKQQLDALCAKLCKITGKNVLLQNRVDTTLVGGIRLQFDGKQLDATVQTQLASLKKSLKQSTL